MRRMPQLGPQIVMATMCMWPALKAPAHDGLDALLAQAHTAVAQRPHQLGPRLHRAALYRKHEEWELAEADLEVATSLSSNEEPAVMLGHAELKLAQGKAEQALPILHRLLNKRDMSLIAHDRLGRAHGQLKQWPDCIRHLSAVLEKHPKPRPEHFIALSEAHGSAEDFENAIVVLQRATKKYGPLLPLEDRLAEYESKLCRHTEAIARLTRAMDDAPRKEFWLARRAELRQAAGQITLARIDRMRALQLIEKQPAEEYEVGAMALLRLRLQEELRLGDQIQKTGKKSPDQSLKSIQTTPRKND